MIAFPTDGAEVDFKYTVIRNPNCNPNDSCAHNGTKLIQVVVNKPDQSLHFLLPGSGVGAPLSIVMLEGDPKPAKLLVNYTKFMSRNGTDFWNSITFKNAHTSYGIVFYAFCIYDDISDAAEITPSEVLSTCRHMLGRNLGWTLTDNSQVKNQQNFIYTAENSTDNNDGMGKIVVNITIPRNENELLDKGTLWLTPGNGLHFEITVDNVTTSKRGRIAPILLPFSRDPVDDSEDFVESTTTSSSGAEPVFNLHLAQRRKLAHFREPGSIDKVRTLGHTPAFVQWRTTCEVTPDRGGRRRGVYRVPRVAVPKGRAKKYQFSLPYAVYGDDFNQKHSPSAASTTVGLRMQTVSLGSRGDGFFAATNFVRWRGVLSMGEPQREDDKGLRSLVAVAIALPIMLLVMLATAGGYFVYHRRQNQRGVNEEEPLLPTQQRESSRQAVLFQCIGGKLRLCRRIPSPQFPRREDEESNST
ncbi:unnamed protein product [Mesocestoides corti]|nr:unnamed protein product [Mesocestoides corti]